MEYMSLGSLYDFIRSTSRGDSQRGFENTTLERKRASILEDVAHGVRFLHAFQPAVIHGDLKSRNVLLDSRFGAKVTDFGLSAKRDFGAAGTPFWMAPELF